MTHFPQRVVATYIGFGLLAKAQGLGCINEGYRWRLTADQAMQHVEHMGFGCHPILKRQFDSAQNGLFVMVQNKGEDLYHLLVTAKPLQQLGLQLSEGLWHLQKRRAIAQSARLALNNSQIMPPVVDRAPGFMMGPVNDPLVFEQDLPFRDNDKPLRIYAQADGPVGEGSGHTVTIALKGDQAGGQHALGLLDESVEGAAYGHSMAPGGRSELQRFSIRSLSRIHDPCALRTSDRNLMISEQRRLAINGSITSIRYKAGPSSRGRLVQFATIQIEPVTDDARSAPRSERRSGATVRSASRIPLEVRLLDISTDGAGFETDRPLPIGTKITLGLAGVGQLKAMIVRQEGKLHGCTFDRAMSHVEVARAGRANTIPFPRAPELAIPEPYVENWPSRTKLAILVGGVVASWAIVMGAIALAMG